MATAEEIIRWAIEKSERGVVRRFGADLAVSGGSLRSIKDAQGLPPRGASEATFNDHWLWLTNAVATANQVRLAESGGYRGEEFELTHHGPDYSTTPVAERYALTRDNPDRWFEALNLAYTEYVWGLDYVSFNPTSNTQREYKLVTDLSLSQNAGDDGRGAVLDILVHPRAQTAALKDRQWAPYRQGGRDWSIFSSSNDAEAEPVVRFHTGVPPQTSETLVIVTKAYRDPLTALTATILSNPNWMKWATLKAMADLHRTPGEAKDDWGQILRKFGVASRLGAFAMQEQGRYTGTHVQSTSRPAGLRTPSRPGR